MRHDGDRTASLGTCGTLALRAGLGESMAETSRALNPREMLVALIEQGQAVFSYAELDRLFAVDLHTSGGRAVFYGARRWLLNTRRIWLENVSGEGYRVVRDGPVIQRAAQRTERAEGKRQERATRMRMLRARMAAARGAGNARRAVETLRGTLPAESDSPEKDFQEISDSELNASTHLNPRRRKSGTAREWVDGRREEPPEVPGLEFGREALERVTQAALSQVYREVARTLVEMAERYAVLAEQALAGMK